MAAPATGIYTPNRRKGGRGVGATNRAPGGGRGVTQIRKSGKILSSK